MFCACTLALSSSFAPWTSKENPICGYFATDLGCWSLPSRTWADPDELSHDSDDFRNAGGEWQDQEVVRDKNWVSSCQPSDIPAFNRAMTELFAEKHKATSGRTGRVA